MENLCFMMPLNGKRPTKTFSFKDEAWRMISGYPKMYRHKGFEISACSLKEVYELLEENQNYNVFLIAGEFIPGTNLKNMVRRKREDGEDGEAPTIQTRAVHCVCLDVDGFGCFADSPKTFIKKLPLEFHSADYIYQYSASYGLIGDSLKCHLFFWFEDPVELDVLKKWARAYNEEQKWGEVIDWRIYSGAQPIYIQRRICEGAEDPIPKNNFIGYVKKEGMVKSSSFLEVDEKKSTRTNDVSSTNEKTYNIENSLKKILTSESFHSELNSLALSLLNKGVSRKDVRGILEGAMNAVKKKCAAEGDYERWRLRFKDIKRAVDSAFRIVDKPALEDLLQWVDECLSEDSQHHSKIIAGFVKKTLKLSAADASVFLRNISKKTGLSINAMKFDVRRAREKELTAEYREKQRKRKDLRASQGVYEINVNPYNSNIAIKKCGRILADSKNQPEVFHYAGGLASIGEGLPVTIKQAGDYQEMGEEYPLVPIIQNYKRPYHSLAARLEKDVIFINENGKETEAPYRILHVLGEGHDTVFRPLTGIVENPFIDWKWNIVQKNGYNAKTGLFSILKNREKIILIDPERAYLYLSQEVFDEFPFNSELDRAVAVSALLTITQRPTLAMDSAGMPGYGIISPIQSSGKTTLAQLISHVVLNRPIAASGFTSDEEELEKRIVAILKEGQALVLFDNIKEGTEVNSSHLARAMSTDIFGGRQLGVNETIKVPSCAIWMFTGNKLTFSGDFATRVYPIYINTKLADPEARTFKRGDLGKWASRNREKIMSAVLSVVMAGKNLHRPVGSSRFKLWDKFVRQPILQISGIDVNDATKNNKKNDAAFEGKKGLLREIHAAFGSHRISTKDIIDKAFGNFDKQNLKTELAQNLEDALGAKAQNTQTLGRYLSKLADIIFDNYTLSVEMVDRNYWTVRKIRE
jgi:hypothetical protein